MALDVSDVGTDLMANLELGQQVEASVEVLESPTARILAVIRVPSPARPLVELMPKLSCNMNDRAL